MKIKNIVLSALAFGGLLLGSFTDVAEANNTKRENEVEVVQCEQVECELKSNEATLFYMYSNNEGHYFLDPNSEYENLIYVGLNDWKVDSNIKINTAKLHHGQKFIGTFDEEYEWELTGIKKAETEYYNEALQDGLELNQTTLFYMYSNENGHYLLDPNAEYENVIFVDDEYFMFTKDELHHDNKFVGTFADSTMWELVGLTKL